MADATARLQFDESIDVDKSKNIVKTSEDMYDGIFTAIDIATGKVEGADDAAGLMNFGRARRESNNNFDNDTGDGTIKWIIEGGQVVKSVTVTGASAASDVNKLVYITDNQTLTLTEPTIGTPIGFIKEWVTGTTCHVQLFSYQGAVMYGMMGTARRTLCVGVVNSKAMEGTSAINIATIKLKGRGKITVFYCVTNCKDAGAVAGSQTLNLELGGTDVTGGLLVVTKDLAQGAKTDASAITAANTFTDGTELQVEMAASGTGYTANQQSLFSLYIEVEYLTGA